MIMLHAHSFNRRRGSVIVLVVAVLALLAVIGTVYIVSARAARNDAGLQNTTSNHNRAVSSVNEFVLQLVAASQLDANGTIGGGTTPTTSTYLPQVLRTR